MEREEQQFPNSGLGADNCSSVQRPANNSQPAAGGEDMDRRRFLITLLGMTGGAIALTFGVPLTGYALSPAMKKEKIDWIPIGNPADFKVGEPTKVDYSFEKIDGWVKSTVKKTAWVVKKSESDILVFSPNCTHLGCGYNWDPGSKQFKCPCHGAVFTMEGDIVSGPQPRPLDRYENKVIDGKLAIGKLIVAEG